MKGIILKAYIKKIVYHLPESVAENTNE